MTTRLKQNRLDGPIRLLLLLWLLFGVSFCSLALKLPPDIDPKQIKKIRPGDLETVVLMGLNDFHGALLPFEYQSWERSGKPSVTYQTGGASILASHVKVLRNEYGSRFLILDAGDHLTGSLDADLLAGKPVVEFYNQLEVSAANIGFSDFSQGTHTLQKRIAEANYPYVSANVLGIPKVQPGILLTAGNLNIGVIGITSTELSQLFNRRDQPERNQLEILNPLKAVQDEAIRLRKKGAHMVILMAYLKGSCALKNTKTVEDERGIWKPESIQGVCSPETELAKLLYDLPKGTLDGVVAGRSHRIIHHWINDIPVIQTGASGLYHNLIYLTYDRKYRQVVPQLTRIEGPIPICRKVFKNQANCNGRRTAPAEGRGALVDAEFRGQNITEDWFTDRLLKYVTDQTYKIKHRKIASAERPIRHNYSHESEMGNLIADALRIKTGADVAFINPGSIRKGFKRGPITYEAIHEALPYNSKVTVLTLTGSELKRVMQIANNGARGFFSVSGLRLELISLDRRAHWKDLNRDGITQHWEVDRLRRVRTPDGKRISNTRKFKVATVDYLAHGGDDLEWIMRRIPANRIKTHPADSLQEMVMEYLTELSHLNHPSQPLIDPARPRLVVNKKSKR